MRHIIEALLIHTFQLFLRMKFTFTIFLCLTYCSMTVGQSFPEFSSLSGRAMNHFSSAKAGNAYIYQLNVPPDGIVMYSINEDAELLDSVAVPNSLGDIIGVQDRLFFVGVEWSGSVFSSMRQVFTEYDAQLDIVQKADGVLFQPIYAPIILEQTAAQINTQSGGFSFYNDTLFSFQKYLVVDSPQVFLGTTNVFSKTGTDGTVYANQPLNINAFYNCFFVENRLFVQGSGYVSPFEPRAFLEFDSEGKLVRGTDYDAYDSGSFLDGALGGWHKGRFYLSYLGYDPTIAGCAADNATIDVRDSNWTVLHRFKLPDCGYLVSGKMPFSFDAQDNVYYAAPHESYKKIMVYKFTPDFQLLWKKELDFDNQPEFYYPLSQLPAGDGGILLNCYQTLNERKLVIFKISASGDVVSSTHLPGNQEIGAMVFPNPTSGLLYVAPGFLEATVAQVSTIDGRFIGVFNLQSGLIDLSAYSSGAYSLSLWDMSRQRFLGTQVVVKQ